LSTLEPVIIMIQLKSWKSRLKQIHYWN